MNTIEPTKVLRPLVRSEYWDPLVLVLTQRKTNCLMKLLNCEPEDLKKLQGQVQELDYFLNLKATITAEVAPRKS